MQTVYSEERMYLVRSTDPTQCVCSRGGPGRRCSLLGLEPPAPSRSGASVEAATRCVYNGG